MTMPKHASRWPTPRRRTSPNSPMSRRGPSRWPAAVCPRRCHHGLHRRPPLPRRFADYLADPKRIVLVAKDQARIAGYAVLVAGTGDDDAVRQVLVSGPATELSKLYVVADQHGSGAAPLLMDTARRRATTAGSRCLWLGVNQLNLRAQRFYLKHGFAVAGTRRFQLGAHVEHDYVMMVDL